MTRPLILASASATRLSLLANAGVPVTQDPAAIDETALKAALRADRASVERAAFQLAEAKALLVAARHPDALVIGADQILECGGEWHDKPPNEAAARAQLLSLAGKRHRLITSAVVVEGGCVQWRITKRANLLMRPFDETFVDHYLAEAGPEILTSVGAYRLEGLGAQLFEDVEGDFFTILGLPLLPLLAYLRSRGELPA